MLAEVIGGLLTSALGVALSPAPIVAVVLMLGSERARSQGRRSPSDGSSPW